MLQFLVRLRGAATPAWQGEGSGPGPGTARRGGEAAARPRDEGRSVRPPAGLYPCPASSWALSPGRLCPVLAPRQRPILGRLPFFPPFPPVPLFLAERCLKAALQMEFHGLFFLQVVLLICLGDSACSRWCSPLAAQISLCKHKYLSPLVRAGASALAILYILKSVPLEMWIYIYEN